MKNLFILLVLNSILTLSVLASDKALIIGIETYKNSPICEKSDKTGCVNLTYGGRKDAEEMERLAGKTFGFKDIRVLKDEQATAQNIRQSVEKWLIAETKPSDRIFFYYSGHGFRIDDTNGDEEDGKDEIITPFDVETFPDLKNYIVDDEINQWLITLQNRRVVMVFDSCHSGTISRSFSSKVTKNSKYLGAEANTVSRGFADGTFSVIPKTRDLSTVVDKYVNNYVGNAVIISASQPNQQAVWFDAKGSHCKDDPQNPVWRGVLTYLFENAEADKSITVLQLSDKLKKGMFELARQDRICRVNENYQVPEVEFSAATADKPLWGADISDNTVDQRPIEALQNSNSKIIVRLNINSHDNSYNIGDTINYSVYLTDSVYVYVVVFSENDVATCIFPKNTDQDNLLEPGNHNMPPGMAQTPTGKDIWVAIASRQKLHLTGKKNVYTWNEILKEIGLNELKGSVESIVKSRGVGVSSKLKPEDWQATSLVMKTLKKDGEK